jgi:hypothetical protein
MRLAKKNPAPYVPYTKSVMFHTFNLLSTKDGIRASNHFWPRGSTSTQSILIAWDSLIWREKRASWIIISKSLYLSPHMHCHVCRVKFKGGGGLYISLEIRGPNGGYKTQKFKGTPPLWTCSYDGRLYEDGVL